MNKLLANKFFLKDILFLILLSIIALALISFYFKANYLNTGYSDWMIHAFRTKLLEQYGFEPWTHLWGNGLSVWRSYQVIPHAITLLFSEVFSVSIPRAMVLLTIVQFVLLRIFIYFSLRKLGIGAISAFFCTLISFDIPHYWKAVGDYSLLFGVTLFPLLTLLWTNYLKGKQLLIYPYIVGICFYIHPLLAIYGFFLWCTGLIFSNRKIISYSTFTQFTVFLASSSIFWLPLLLRQPYQYTNSLFSSITFFYIAIRPYSFYGLSIFIFVYIITTFILIAFKKIIEFFWFKPLLVFTTVFLLLVIVGTFIQLPKFLTQTQFVRGIIFIGLLSIFVVSPVFQYLINIKSFLLKLIIVIVFTLMFVEGISYTSLYAPQPVTNYQEPIQSYSKLHEDFNSKTHRAWTPVLDYSSYFASQNTFMAGAYNEHLQPNPIPVRLPGLINYQTSNQEIPSANMDRVKNYLKLNGTDYLFLDESSPFTKSFSANDSGYDNLGRLSLSYSIFHIFRYKDQIINAAIIDPSLKNKIDHFSFDTNIDEIAGQSQLDSYVDDFVDVIYDKRNIILPLKYPSETTMTISIPSDRKSNLVYINETFDTNWKAVFDNKLQKIQPVGPNYMLVILDSSKEGELVLQNSWPRSFWLSLIVIAIIPVVILILNIIPKKIKKQHDT